MSHAITDWNDLREAREDVQQRAAFAVQGLLDLERAAQKIAELAQTAFAPLISQIKLREEATDLNSFEVGNKMAGLHRKVKEPLTTMSQLQTNCLKIIEGEDEVLTPLRNEGIALLRIAETIEKGGTSLHEKRATLERDIHEFNAAAARSFLGLLDGGLRARRGELEVVGLNLEDQARLAGWAVLVRIELTPSVEHLTNLSRRAQLQRGLWNLLGLHLKGIAQLLGHDVPGMTKWRHSRTYPRIQLLHLRQVAEGAATYVVTTEPARRIPPLPNLAHTMNEPNDPLAADKILAKTDTFLNARWLQEMHAYVNVIEGVNAPAPPQDRPGMTTKNRDGEQIQTVPELMARTKTNAKGWMPLLHDIITVAGAISQYASKSVVIVGEIADKSKTVFARAAWAACTPAEREEHREEFDEMVNDLIKAAKENQIVAVRVRDAIIKYRSYIKADHSETEDVQAKYKDWMKEEDLALGTWEKEHGLQQGETESLIDKLREDVQNCYTKWSGLTSGAVGSALFLVILPPFGAIAAIAGMTSMSILAEEFKRQMAEFEVRLGRVKKFNEVKIFFKILNKELEAILAATDRAITALEEISGMWGEITISLTSVQKEVKGLPGDKGWDAPVFKFRRTIAVDAYKELVKHCSEFVRHAYVSEVKTITPVSQP